VKTVFLFITEGFRIRNLLYSDVLALLRQRYRVVIIVPPPDVDSVSKAFGAENVFVEPRPQSPSRFESNFAFVRRYLLSNPARNRTISVFSSVMKKHQPFHYWLVTNVNPWLGRSASLRKAWLGFESLINRGGEYAPLFERYKPSLVVSTDYGSQTQEIRIMRAAAWRGIKVTSVVYSWDNFSSKGVMGAIADRFVVWSETMRREAQELHDIPPDRVDVCGAAQFDIYGHPERLASREEFCASLDLDPARPIIVQGTIPPRYFPSNVEISEILIDGILNGPLPRNAQLLLRLHPQTINKGVAADSLEPYHELVRKFPFVKVDVPATVLWGSLVSPGPKDSQRLAEILRHAAVLIHPGSTLAVDSAAMDCPVIGLGFDGHKEKPYDESIRRWWDYTYMQPVVRSKGQPIANTREELYTFINSYIQDRRRDADGRARIREWVSHKVDGKSSERVVEALIRFVES
jgi:hypothetical protein